MNMSFKHMKRCLTVFIKQLKYKWKLNWRATPHHQIGKYSNAWQYSQCAKLRETSTLTHCQPHRGSHCDPASRPRSSGRQPPSLSPACSVLEPFEPGFWRTTHVTHTKQAILSNNIVCCGVDMDRMFSGSVLFLYNLFPNLFAEEKGKAKETGIITLA